MKTWKKKKNKIYFYQIRVINNLTNTTAHIRTPFAVQVACLLFFKKRPKCELIVNIINWQRGFLLFPGEEGGGEGFLLPHFFFFLHSGISSTSGSLKSLHPMSKNPLPIRQHASLGPGAGFSCSTSASRSSREHRGWAVGHMRSTGSSWYVIPLSSVCAWNPKDKHQDQQLLIFKYIRFFWGFWGKRKKKTEKIVNEWKNLGRTVRRQVSSVASRAPLQHQA